MAAILDLPEVRARVTRWGIADYERLSKLGAAPRCAELLRGLIVEKMPGSPSHEFLTDGIAGGLRRLVRAELLVRQEASLRFADSLPEPDVSVVRGRRDDFHARHPTTAELVVEVAVGSVALDRENASLYAEARVAEYHVVLGEAKQVEVCRRPENGACQEKRTYSREEAISARFWRSNRSPWRLGSRKAHGFRRVLTRHKWPFPPQGDASAKAIPGERRALTQVSCLLLCGPKFRSEQPHNPDLTTI